MHLGSLIFNTIKKNDPLVTASVANSVYENAISDQVFVTEIDPSFADTAAFCEHFSVDQDISTNCLVIEARRADKTWYAACLVLASHSADVNGTIRKQLGARKTSFAPKELALELTRMEYGGITPIGLPNDWTILVDEAVMEHATVVVGGGIRGSKIAVHTAAFLKLPNTVVIDIKKKSI